MARAEVELLTVPGPHGDREVRLTSPDKIYFPERGITKREVVGYYVRVADVLERVLHLRPTNLKRYPDGVAGEAFYVKRMPKGAPPYAETARVTFPSGRTADSFCPTEPATVVWAANLGTFDFHPWPVRRADTDHPDELRIDLDPQPGTGFTDAVAVAGVLREVLDEAGLVGWPKTSGGRGIHVAVRIRPEWSFVDVRHAVIAIGRRVADRIPERATVAWWKEERGERVFLDYNQAARDRTIASAWSVRGRPRATVSMPVTWEALPDVEPEDFDVRTVPGLLDGHGDAHAGLDDAVCGLETVLEWYDADGRGDLPYPPEYPKMKGEPKRVQPSRSRADTLGKTV
ncbi:non-homologous end-joining DNA ligase [Pseudonocardia sp.]|uniref:non-homologous end-joining DNA ligase n=1 Tax=Pseudonocardia sp. TaxID=60912 RepID=UPI003D0F6FD2